MIRPLLLPLLGGLCLFWGAAASAGPAPGEAGEPLSMETAVRQALRHNPAVEIAARERNAALAAAERNRPAFRPEVTATASQLLRAPRVDLPGTPDDVVLPNAISRLEIGLRQPVFQFGAGGAPAARANAMAAAARSDYRSALLDTALEAREAFLAVRRAAAFADVARQGLELARENVRVTQLLIDRGFQAEVDLLEAQRAEAEAEGALLQAENGTALARANLNRVMGRPLDAPFQPAGPEALPEAPPPAAELAREALARRPEPEALRHAIAAAEAGIRLARAQRQPRVNLEAVYALQTETALVPRSGFAAGVSVTAPIFGGAAGGHTVREAEERLAQLRGALAAREQGIALEVERQRLAMLEAAARRETAIRGVRAAEKAFEITRLRMDLARATQLEMLSARLALTRSRSDQAAAENDLHLARVRLDRALGREEPAGASPGEER